MIGRERDRVSFEEARYREGLKKLADTEVVVAELQTQIEIMQPKVEVAAKAAGELMIVVQRDQEAADKQQAIVEADVSAANVTAGEVDQVATAVQADLDAALPAYYEALESLKSLDKKAVQEVKSFAKPPEMVSFTLEAVCVLFAKKPSWDEGKKLMNDPKFIENLLNFDKDNMEAKWISTLKKKYLSNERFTPEAVGKVSSAAKCLCMWVHAMVTYDMVAKTIAPKKASLEKAQAELAEVMAKVDAKKAELQGVLDKVAGLQKKLADTIANKADLEGQAQTMLDQMGRAEKLLGGLGGEKVRWRESADRLAAQKVTLVGDIMLSAGTLAYLGPFTAEYRRQLTEAWIVMNDEKGIPVGGAFTLEVRPSEQSVVSWWRGGVARRGVVGVGCPPRAAPQPRALLIPTPPPLPLRARWPTL